MGGNRENPKETPDTRRSDAAHCGSSSLPIPKKKWNFLACFILLFKSPSLLVWTDGAGPMSGSEEALEARVKALEEEVEQLRAQLRGKSDAAQRDAGENGGSGKKRAREFDFGAHPRRHVALRLAYLGWQYQGFAVQENTDNTVEARVFEALLKTKLIRDRQSSNYHRCGRTDKGVSAFAQVRRCVLSWRNICAPDYLSWCVFVKTALALW